MTTATYAKYCPNVWLAKCASEHAAGAIIPVANKYGKESDCEIHKLIAQNAESYFYSITRCDGINRQTYAQQRAARYESWARSANARSDDYLAKANEGKDFLSLGEPIKIGHHSEKRHRALFERNNERMRHSIAHQEKAKSHENKAEYWESMAGKIDLSMPESVDYFSHQLEIAIAHHAGLKDGSIERTHSMSLAYSSKKVKDLKATLATAIKLWQQET